jgi:hypothetical protein
VSGSKIIHYEYKILLDFIWFFPLAVAAHVKHPISQLQTQSPQSESPPDSVCDNMIFNRSGYL